MLSKKFCEKYGLKMISSLAVCAVISGSVPVYAGDCNKDIKSNVNNEISASDNNQSALNNALSESADNSDIIVNSRLKEFTSLDKVRKYTGFDFKVPDYIVKDFCVNVIRVFNEADGRNELELQFVDKNTGMWYSIEAFTTDPVKTLTKEFEEMFEKADVTTCSKNIDGINGQYITLINSADTSEASEKCSYFAWKDDNVWYCINYNDNIGQNIGEEEFAKIALSLKTPAEVSNVSYVLNYEDDPRAPEDETYEPSISIYDKEDFKKACESLGYTPKMPLKINDNIVISDAFTNIDRYGKSLYSYYSYDKDLLVFIQTKDKDRYKYENIASTGYSTLGSSEKADKLSISGVDVYRYADNDDGKIVYQWKEDSMYYFFEIYYDNGVIEYADDVVKEFVKAKPVQ